MAHQEDTTTSEADDAARKALERVAMRMSKLSGMYADLSVESAEAAKQVQALARNVRLDDRPC